MIIGACGHRCSDGTSRRLCPLFKLTNDGAVGAFCAAGTQAIEIGLPLGINGLTREISLVEVFEVGRIGAKQGRCGGLAGNQAVLIAGTRNLTHDV